MIAKIVVASVIAIISFICLILAVNENTVNGTTDKIRAVYGSMIYLSSVVFAIAVFWLIFY